MDNKSANEILLEAAILLEEEGKWIQGDNFEFNDKGCSMCAHGAIAYCGLAEVREKVLQGNRAATSSPVAMFAVKEERYADLAYQENLTVEQYLAKHYKGETTVAHYKAAQVGLTFAYNDAPNTTKQDVIAKLRLAAQS